MVLVSASSFTFHQKSPVATRTEGVRGSAWVALGLRATP